MRRDDAYGHVLSGRLSSEQRSALIQRLIRRNTQATKNGRSGSFAVSAAVANWTSTNSQATSEVMSTMSIASGSTTLGTGAGGMGSGSFDDSEMTTPHTPF